jgi:Ca2+-binding RTX toxin-like protein
LMLQAAPQEVRDALKPSPPVTIHVHDQGVQSATITKSDFGQGIIKAIDTTYQPKPGEDFLYAGPAAAPGELPSNQIGEFHIRDQNNNPLADIFGFKPLTFTQLATLDTLAKMTTYFFSGDDTISGSTGNDYLNGYAGNDNISGDRGNDELHGGLGKDILSGDTGNDKLYGDDGNDGILGGSGNDYAYGGNGNDAVDGGDGLDHLYGGAGNDKIYGGFGADILSGGAGHDTFFYRNLPKFSGKESGPTSSTRDTILDFTHGQDKIDVSFILIPAMHFLG